MAFEQGRGRGVDMHTRREMLDRRYSVYCETHWCGFGTVHSVCTRFSVAYLFGVHNAYILMYEHFYSRTLGSVYICTRS